MSKNTKVQAFIAACQAQGLIASSARGTSTTMYTAWQMNGKIEDRTAFINDLKKFCTVVENKLLVSAPGRPVKYQDWMDISFVDDQFIKGQIRIANDVAMGFTLLLMFK